MNLINLSAVFLILAVCVGPLRAVELEKALKMAQCRAHCINKFDVVSTVQDDKLCKEKANCFMCWQTCEKLSTAYPIWSYNCGQKRRCDFGCQTACDFINHQESMVPLSAHKSRLTLIFRRTWAEWSLEWGQGVPPQKAVFALFTREPGRPWKLRVQTANYRKPLDDVQSGTELKLVAVAESGLLSVIITPFEPPLTGAPGGDFPWNKESVVSDDDQKGWPLIYRAHVEDSGLVAANVRWSSQGPSGSSYLVTWEVAGGGLKGHLYTDLPQVGLTLWPETVYKVRVEVVSAPPHRASQLLILDTHNITETQDDQWPIQPLVMAFDEPLRLEVIIGGTLGAFTALAVVVVLLYRSTRCRRTFDDSASANSKLTLTRSVADFSFEETLVRPKGSTPSLPQGPLFVSPPVHLLSPQNTLGIPNSRPHRKHSSISMI